MRHTPTVAEQENMRMCRFCIHSHISDLGYNHCWHADSTTSDRDSPTGVCWAFRDNRVWIPCYLSTLTSSYRGNICWAKKVYAANQKRILRYEIIDPVKSTIAECSPKNFAKEYIVATPGMKPPYTMKEYEEFDIYCLGEGDHIKELTQRQERRNYNEAHYQDILAQEAIDKQLKQETS